MNNIASLKIPLTYGNMGFNLEEIEEECQPTKDFLKRNMSMVSTGMQEPSDKIASHFNINKNVLKPFYFQRFHVETLFYIFYYMPLDTLQIFAANELYAKGWKFNYNFQIWFTNEVEENQETISEFSLSEKLFYFHPTEWVKKEYFFDTPKETDFLMQEELNNYKNKVI